ncbi:unnamed protein product [Eruca vesicaria subsp. sativa]|uniref:SKP1-like protein n=1 Tax=Eruca vesicaria subsp. sativa TaxID=29727 RepID=A0ABC8J712_ERUVS|nr:unnamed protein product [Eruca vesicaria subsp. sativa]
MEKFVLKSSDNVSFEVEEAVVRQCKMLFPMVQDCAGRVCPIKNVTGEILEKVVEYCKKHVVVVHGGDSSSSSNSSSGDDLKKWDAEFISKMDLSTVHDLIKAVDYLDIKGLFDLTCQRFADEIRACKGPEEMREKFNIENDFTAEEEGEIRRKNAWAFDEREG